MFKKIILASVVLGLSGCVKLQILPDDAVENSIKAGKNLYDEVKLKSRGGTKREYASQVSVSEFSNRDEAEQSCLDSLKVKLESDSTQKSPVVVSEKIIVVDGMEANIIECQVVGFIWQA